MSHRTAIVTGASRGLGLALTAGLVDVGWRVVVDARGGRHLATATAELSGSVITVPGDLTDPDHRRHLVDVAGPGLALVVNNAGGLGPSPLPALTDYPLDQLRNLFDTNVISPLGLVQLAAPVLSANHGTVVNITSDAAVEAYEGWGGYSATKAALEQIGVVLAVERSDLRVLTVDPGDMRTQMHQDAFPGEDISDRPLPEVSVPGIVSLIEGTAASGRYRAREVAVA